MMVKKLLVSLGCILIGYFLFLRGIKSAREQGRADFEKFNAANINSKITWIGPYQRGEGFKVIGMYKMKYSVYGILRESNKTFTMVAHVGDSVIKPPSSDSIILIKKDGRKYIFDVFK